ncbi:MAG: diphosphate--fructose-6-phosphate 1-phosphotransferase [Phycisphaerae bacterium]|nr:diphosphate--fructose-6-phosphate 1-phosphotransferase [Phycisphaerae bacterium]
MNTLTGNAVVGQSGGPTAVINQSLVGVIEGLKETLVAKGVVTSVFGMLHGVNGLVKGSVKDLANVPAATLARVADTPGAALGSSRDKPDQDYCAKILQSCEKLKIRYFFYIGGNDSSDTCRIVNDLARKAGYELRCYHVPKTVDNDLAKNDHTPGYPSAARFVATAFMADSLDNRSLPGVKINVVMGRHAGFLTAAAALARRLDDDGPHLVYLPEVPFDSDRFIADVERVYARLGRCQIAVSEGIQDRNGRPIAATLVEQIEQDAHGNVQLSGSGALGDALAELVKDRLMKAANMSKPPRVRADTFGYLQRCWPDASPVDRQEARDAGRAAARLALEHTDGSIALVRASSAPYRCEFRRIELTDVAAKTRHMPPEFIDGHSNVAKAFLDYARPLVGELPLMERL